MTGKNRTRVRPSFRKSFTLDATPTEVFSLLTDARKIRRWSGQKGTVQPKIGGRFSMFDGWAKGVVLAYAPGKLLSTTWIAEDWGARALPSIVSYRFARHGRKTRVSIVHRNLTDTSAAAAHRSGWYEFVINPLKHHLTLKHKEHA